MSRKPLSAFVFSAAQRKDLKSFLKTKGKELTEEELEELEKRILSKIPKVRDGKDADEDAIVSRIFSAIRIPEDGRDADENRIIGVLMNELQKLIPEQRKITVEDVEGLDEKLENLQKENVDNIRRNVRQIGGPTQFLVKSNGQEISRVDSMNFIGATVSPTGNGTNVDITISSGGVTSIASADSSVTVTNPTTTADLSVVKAPKWSTARNLAGNIVDGSTDVAFSNKFIVQGTSDSGLSGAQFLGSLSTGIIKNTTTTGVLSIATPGTDYVVPAAALTTGSIPFADGSGQLAQDNSNLFWDNTNKRVGIRTSTPAHPLEVVNASGGTTERLIGATNANTGTGSTLIRSAGIAIGNGSSYSLGYASLWGQKGDGTFIRWLDLTAFATNFVLPLFLNNNQAVQSATTLGQTISMATVTNANHVRFGSPYPAAIPVDFYIGNNTVNYTWFEYTGGTTIMTLSGIGNLSVPRGYVKTQTTTVASLPAAATAGVGARLFVTDALTPTWGAAVVGGGAVPVPVYSDGTNWNVG